MFSRFLSFPFLIFTFLYADRNLTYNGDSIFNLLSFIIEIFIREINTNFLVENMHRVC